MEYGAQTYIPLLPAVRTRKNRLIGFSTRGADHSQSHRLKVHWIYSDGNIFFVISGRWFFFQPMIGMPKNAMFWIKQNYMIIIMKVKVVELLVMLPLHA